MKTRTRWIGKRSWRTRLAAEEYAVLDVKLDWMGRRSLAISQDDADFSARWQSIKTAFSK
jgi:hypothetical protein